MSNKRNAKVWVSTLLILSLAGWATAVLLTPSCASESDAQTATERLQTQINDQRKTADEVAASDPELAKHLRELADKNQAALNEALLDLKKGQTEDPDIKILGQQLSGLGIGGSVVGIGVMGYGWARRRGWFQKATDIAEDALKKNV